MTQPQKDMVQQTIDVALSNYLPGGAAASLLDVVYIALAKYPTDRSCHTCDSFVGRDCAHWDHREVPLPEREAGCDEWKGEDGVPF